MSSYFYSLSKSILLCIVILAVTNSGYAQSDSQRYTLVSPDEKIEVEVQISSDIRYSVRINGNQILKPSSLALTIQGKGTLGANPVLQDKSRQEINNVIHPVVNQKSSEIVNHYNELALTFEKGFKVIFRAYNDGIAYRFKTDFEEQVYIADEELNYNFADNYPIYFPEEDSFITHQERLYKHYRLNNISSDQFSSLPALVDVPDGPKLLVGQADLQDYPGYYLQGTASSRLTGIMPHAALEETLLTDRNYYPTKRGDYLAKTEGNRTFPWRVLGVAHNDEHLITNQLIYKLADPLQIKDPSWINPGKVSWDWWNANNIYDVDFKAGINTKTYKHYIDFASQLGLDYVILDEGWYELGNLLEVSPDIDIPELVAYGKKKDVDIILWVVWKTLEDQFKPAFEQFSEWGIKGIKVDFMQRDDQWMVNWYWKVAREAAKREILVNFHGSYKPTGLRRAYPNVITREGVKGLENNKWEETITPEHDVTIPFIRMAAGPMDYTPGAMINAQPQNFRPIFNRPMSQGTRVHQLAMYVVYESPLQMLADSPTHYMKQKQDIRDYLSAVPTTWDQTRVLKGEIGDYIAVARKKGSRWFIGAMTDENARDLSLDLSFLDEGTYRATIYRDGINANRYATDYESVTKEISAVELLNIHMAKGGGWTAIIEKAD